MKNKIKRFERKWLFKSNNSLSLINALIRSNLFFRTQYPTRKVNSVYFDTYSYTSIRQNLDGVSYKKKIRVRWYGNREIINNPVIEIKSKKGFETKKESIAIKELQICFPKKPFPPVCSLDQFKKKETPKIEGPAAVQKSS